MPLTEGYIKVVLYTMKTSTCTYLRYLGRIKMLAYVKLPTERKLCTNETCS